jgi:hypothetical protein
VTEKSLPFLSGTLSPAPLLPPSELRINLSSLVGKKYASLYKQEKKEGKGIASPSPYPLLRWREMT